LSELAIFGGAGCGTWRGRGKSVGGAAVCGLHGRSGRVNR
jgi:hypothetical protein